TWLCSRGQGRARGRDLHDHRCAARAGANSGRTAMISDQLLLRYDVPGPRYTSYPTVPVWRDDFGPDQYAARLGRAGRDQASPLSLYVHLPFCREMCSYCGCNVVITQDQRRADSYLDTLEGEVDLVASRLGRRRTVSQIHWGGGTPTFLDEAQLARLWT